MKPVFLHLHSRGKSDWENQKFDFGRVPVEGEYITVASDSEWYQVELVLHTPFSEEMCAEVYAIKVDGKREFRKKVNSVNNARVSSTNAWG
jgi:hypothetical protein